MQNKPSARRYDPAALPPVANCPHLLLSHARLVVGRPTAACGKHESLDLSLHLALGTVFDPRVLLDPTSEPLHSRRTLVLAR